MHTAQEIIKILSHAVAIWFNSAINCGAKQGLKILGSGADGDSKLENTT